MKMVPTERGTIFYTANRETVEVITPLSGGARATWTRKRLAAFIKRNRDKGNRPFRSR